MIQILVYFIIIFALTKPVGHYLCSVFEGKCQWLSWLEKPAYKLLGVKQDQDQNWKEYAVSLLVFSLFSVIVTYLMLRLQGLLPLNPQKFGGDQMPPHLAFNTANSFASNTDWQSYTPETSVSYLTNMVTLAVQNWASAAVGLAVAVALVRGLARKSASGIGSFWVDMVRGTVYVFLPASIIGALIMVAGGVPQTFDAPHVITTLQGFKQIIPFGPVASQEIIKMLGTNGGGFFNANSAHPFENPSSWMNLFQMVLIFIIPAGLTTMFGKMVGNVRQGWAVFAAMAILFLGGAFICNRAEKAGNPNYAAYGVSTQNMEGKEVRFGIGSSALFTTITTSASCGAVNSMIDSYTPIGGAVPLFNILTGEVVFGGVGAGLYGMLIFAILAVFIAGLMVGRTPEYLGKKVGKFEVQMAILAILAMSASILGFTAIACVFKLPTHGGLASWNTMGTTSYGPTAANINNPGPHGFSEILYAFTSATGNNGSAFAGLNVNTPIYNTLMGVAMIIGRFLMIIPALAIAGSMAAKKKAPVSAGTFPTDSATFAMLLVGIVVLVGALNFFPALALGPIVEHLRMLGYH